MSRIVQIFTSRRMLVMLLLGFSSGLPLALTAGTLQAWMKTVSIDIKTIGLFALIGWPYTIKYLWSPLMDRYCPPWLGRRRGWILVTQLLLVVSTGVLGFLNPSTQLVAFALLATLIAFFSASQDIVIDAYRTELLSDDERGAGAAISNTGYRLAMLTSGALALILSDHMDWSEVYLIMAGAMAIGILGTIIAPEPSEKVIPPRSIPEAVLLPFFDFFRRARAFEVLAFILLYKLGDVLAMALSTPFMMELGFTRQEIGYVSKGVGFASAIVGSLVGGALMVKLTMRQSLYYFGVVQCGSIIYFSHLAMVGRDYTVMAIAVAIENFCSGLGTAAFVAFLMSLCNKRFSATQYALLSSLAALTRILVGSSTGYIAVQIGWPMFFVFSTAAAIPALLLVLWRYDLWQHGAASAEVKP